MMNRLFALLLVLMISGVADARTYRCVAEAGAYVAHGGGDPIKAGVADVSDRKYILTDELGPWMVKELGHDKTLFDKCVSSHFCQDSALYSGTFLRDEDGVFSVTWFTRAGDKEQPYIYLNVAKGHCEKFKWSDQ
jgi:hypothetical protein